MNQRTILRAAGCGLVVLGAAAYSLWPSTHRAGSSRMADDGTSSGAGTVSSAAPARSAGSENVAAAGPPVDPGDPRFDHRADRVSHAIAMLRFPPSSQPLRKDMKDVLQPNRRWENALPLALAIGASGSGQDPPKEGDLSYEFTGNAFSVIGSSSLVATLEVFHADHQRIAVDVTAATVTAVDTGKVVATVSLTDDGNHLYSASITPSAIDGLGSYRGVVKLDVGFVASEGDHRPAQASLDFKVSGSAPAVFNGVSGEKLSPDGLEIDVDVQVTEPGQYFVQGCLFDAKDEPIGFAVARPQLVAGRGSVPLVFFGLLFHDANVPGPYVFKTLTGNRMPAPGEADHADMDAWTGSYRTQAYAVSDFSDKEYESPQKDAKIQALSDLAARGKARAASSGN